MTTRHVRPVCFVATALLPFVGFAGARPADPVPPGAAPTAPTGARLPDDLIFNEAVDETKDRPRFNDFSWKAFVALNWPAVGGRRGEPDLTKRFGADAPHVVWGTWKSLDELFPPDPKTAPPTEWPSFDAELAPLAPNKVSGADAGKRRILGQAIRLSTVAQAGSSAKKLPPLVAQNGTYVRYEVRMNKVAYDFIRDNKYYLRETFTRTTGAGNEYRLAFPDGSVVVKAAWMELKDADPKGRFYRIEAEIEEPTADPTRTTLRKATVGLVGLHIAHKTPQRPSWIWSTFEHVDNTEPGPGADRASFSKNDPNLIYDVNNVDEVPQLVDETKPLPTKPKPVDVHRAYPVHYTTRNVNLAFYKSDDVKGTVWQNYRLIATQWFGNPDPAVPELGLQLEIRKRLFPKQAANTTLETYRQEGSCVGCHTSATHFRFMFFPSVRAFPPVPAP